MPAKPGYSATLFAVVVLLFLSVTAVRADDPENLYSLPPEPDHTTHVVSADEVRDAKREGIDVLTHLYGEKAHTIARFNRIDPKFVRGGRRLRIPVLAEHESYAPLPVRYREAEAHEKFLLIVRDRQFLGAYENGSLVASYPVSTGSRDHRTPKGLTKITRKDKDHVSSSYPEPDGGWPMPWALRFRGTAYWIHSGDLPGYPASHGCVRMYDADAKTLFEWAEQEIPVRVVGSLE